MRFVPQEARCKEKDLSMTQRRPKLQDEINKLAHDFAIPVEDKLLRRLERLDRMSRFYADKIPDAPERQGFLFQSFVSALKYADTVMNMYQQLTTRLNELAEVEDD